MADKEKIKRFYAMGIYKEAQIIALAEKQSITKSEAEEILGHEITIEVEATAADLLAALKEVGIDEEENA